MTRTLFHMLAALTWLLLVSGTVLPQDRPRFILVAHGAATDRFWGAVKEGAERAAEEAGVELSYRAPEQFDLKTMADLVDAAVAEKPAGLIVSIPSAEALAGPLQGAAAAGIPVISINSGLDVAASLGSLLHVGQSEYEAGRVAGEAMRELGGTKALCLNHETGNVALDLRCKGFIDGFAGSVEVVAVSRDAGTVGDEIEKALAADPQIDVIMALSASIAGEPAVAAAQALAEGRRVHVGSFDATEGILRAVADRAAAFAIDQQPFLQGYLPVQYLVLHHHYDMLPVSNVNTGPRLIDADDAAVRLARTGSDGVPAAANPPAPPDGG